MKTASAGVVTARGVRDGDPTALTALCERRGAAVLAYCEELLSGPVVGVAAADAFARFRREVVAAGRLDAVNPEALLLRSTRRAALERAPTGDGGRSLRDMVRGRRAACDVVPELLAAHAEELLSEADEERLARHLSACSACHDLAERFMRAEHAYRDPPDEPVPPRLVNTIVAALAAAAGEEAVEDTHAGRVHGNGEVSHRAARSALPGNGAPPRLVVPALEPAGFEHERAPSFLTRLLAGDFTVRVLVPAAVVAAGIAVTLAIAGVFSSSDQGGAPAPTPNTLPTAKLAPAALVAASHAPASSVPDELAKAAALAQQTRLQAAARAAQARRQTAAPTTDTGASSGVTAAETAPPSQSVQKVTPTAKHYSAQKVRKRTTKRPPSSPSSPSGSGTTTGTTPGF